MPGLHSECGRACQPLRAVLDLQSDLQHFGRDEFQLQAGPLTLWLPVPSKFGLD